MRTSAAAKAQLREEILLRAIPFLKESGVAGAPVDKIMAEVGLTSGALYSHFKSKDDFFNQVVLRELVRLNDLYRARSEKMGARESLESFIETYLSEKHVRGVGEGCLFAALGSDLKRASADERAEYESLINENLDILGAGLINVPASDRRSRMRFIWASLVGTMVTARTLKSRDAIRELLELATRSIRETISK